MMVQSLFKADVANSVNVIVSPAFNFGIPVDACVTVAKAPPFCTRIDSAETTSPFDLQFTTASAVAETVWLDGPGLVRCAAYTLNCVLEGVPLTVKPPA